jgi:hypothetical protein
MFLYFPLAGRPFFLRIGKDTGKIILTNGKTVELAPEDVSMVKSKMIPPAITHLGYSPEDIEKIKEILNRPQVTIDVLIPMVQDVKTYEETNEMDVVVSGHTFRLKDRDFLQPLNFQIWCASVLHISLDISKEEWRTFVQFLVNTAKQEKEDPLSPPAIDEIVKKIKMTNIYGDFSDPLMETWVDGARESMLMMDGKLYIPASVIESITKKLDIGKRKVRDILQPILDPQGNTILRKRWNGKPISKRVWIIDWEKLKSMRDIGDIKIIGGKDGVQTQKDVQ